MLEAPSSPAKESALLFNAFDTEENALSLLFEIISNATYRLRSFKLGNIGFI